LIEVTIHDDFMDEIIPEERRNFNSNADEDQKIEEVNVNIIIVFP
jgi:hypothetical protein